MTQTFDAAFLVRWLATVAEAVDREADRLTELDSAIGDADHGANLRRGFAAVTAALAEDPPATPGGALAAAGRQLISTVGGASGPLYGTLLRRTGKALGDDPRVTREQLAEALGTGVAAVSQLGGAQVGDKTMLDALTPAVDGLRDSFGAARTAAEEGALATVPLRARKGRASYLGERSVGHQDPGATSSALLFAALDEVARGEASRGQVAPDEVARGEVAPDETQSDAEGAA
ncbi:dihydroxyacetone kinase subunit L [Streptomyces sp. adm13(2018)]|uniref:dihydroxyacetone kinase subunit DhaL n=1 Tax=Streptomyces sp. adm13(2018) TaxID=2479007 RepID=UPI0011CEC713|nr:dihydroxyacetone kinase subunit DhaL [Streptomyces sp. adm13(2018)]TXS22317.1 dihydroxyacetone kinase subunit L [Streptomyces sp. adm13(2018)]